MYINYGGTTVGMHTILRNGAMAGVEILNGQDWVGIRNQKIKKSEEMARAGMDLENTVGLKDICTQLENSEVIDGYIELLIEAILTGFSDNVCLLKRTLSDSKKEESPALDTKKFGNIVGFNDPNELFFVISHEKEAEMMSKLENPPFSVSGSLPENFRTDPPMLEKNILKDSGGEKVGFSVWVKIGTEQRKISFLLSKTEQEMASGEKDVK
jgi:hypothetical protein